MQIVIPDDCYQLFEGSESLGRLRALGDVHYYTDNADSEELLRDRLQNAEIILTTRYQTDFKTTDLLDHIPHLKMISVMGTRPRMIDMERVNERGIVVSTTPAASASSVAEHTMMLILALTKRIPLTFPAMREGGWPQDQGVELAGKTLGLIGFGHIARLVCRMALGFGMRVVTCSPSMTPERAQAEGAEAASVEECLASDVVSLHLHLPAGAAPFMTREKFAQMKETAFFINTARAQIVDEDALLDALRNRRIAGAGLDVFEPFEPLPKDSIYRSLDNVIITPHSAWITDGTYARFRDVPVANIEAFLRGAPANVVRENA